MIRARNAIKKILRTCQTPKKSGPILVLLYLIIQISIAIGFGINTGIEAEKYIYEGELLYSTGSLSASKYIFYLPIILVVAACKILGISVKWAVIINLITNAVATALFYKMISRIANSKKAFWGTLILITFIPLQIWNWTLYSESIFISLSIIYIYLIRTRSGTMWKWTLSALAFLPLLIFSRPHGLLFIPPLIISTWIFYYRKSGIWPLISMSSVLVVVMLTAINFAFKGGGDMDAMKPFIEEHIICFVPTNKSVHTLVLTENGSPLEQLGYYMIHNPIHFLKLLVLKLISFFNLYRPYYSINHNTFLATWMILIYGLILRNIKSFIKKNPETATLLLPILALYPLGATFQCDDWHSRFTMPIIPVLLMIAFSKNDSPTEASRISI